MTTSINNMHRNITFLPRAIAQQLKPVLTNVMSGALAPLTLQQGIETNQAEIDRRRKVLEGILTPEEERRGRMQLTQEAQADAAKFGQESRFEARLGQEVSAFEFGTKTYRTLRAMAEQMARSQWRS